MNETQVKIGRVYTAKVTNRDVSVRIDAKHPDGGWKAVNLATGKPVRIEAGKRLGREVTKDELRSGKAPGMRKPRVRRSRKKPPAKATPKPAAKKPMTSRAATKPAKKLSGLDAAHKVLLESNEALSCREIVDVASEKGYWRSDAATPHATLHAAISREIRDKDAASRFNKVARGKFAANG